jgi:hypothetical protein
VLLADFVLASAPSSAGGRSPGGRHCHCTLSLTVIDRHSLGIYTVTLLLLVSFFSQNDSVGPG